MRARYFLFALLVGGIGLVGPSRLHAKKSTGSRKSHQAEPSCTRGEGVWRRVLQRRHKHYCSLVIRARARLWSQPEVAEELALQAAEEVPQADGAKLLLAHAKLLNSDASGAHEIFESTLGLKTSPAPRALTTQFQVAAGRAALIGGHYSAALRNYRRAVLRLGELQSEKEEARVLIEASIAASYESKDRGREARNYLQMAQNKVAPLLVEVIESAWALSLYRDDDIAASRALVSHFKKSWKIDWIFDRQGASVGKRDEILPVMPESERFALAAVVAEAIEPDLAPRFWSSFISESSIELPTHIKRRSVHHSSP